MTGGYNRLEERDITDKRYHGSFESARAKRKKHKSDNHAREGGSGLECARPRRSGQYGTANGFDSVPIDLTPCLI